MGVLSAAERATLAAAAERLLPGSAASGVGDYLEHLLGALSYDPPHVWAGGPFSGRHGGDASFDEWIPLGPMERRAWEQRIGAWRAQYRELLDALGPDFVHRTDDEKDELLARFPELRGLLYEHACESHYGDPVYGGNKDFQGWYSIGWVGDIQPRGYTDDEVTQRDKSPIPDRWPDSPNRGGIAAP